MKDKTHTMCKCAKCQAVIGLINHELKSYESLAKPPTTEKVIRHIAAKIKLKKIKAIGL